MKRSLRLAAFVDQIFWFDGERYSTDEAFIKFITAFNPYFAKIILLGRVSPQRKGQKYVLDPWTTEVQALPFYKDVYSLWKNGITVLPAIYKIFSKHLSDYDLVWLCGPHPISLMFAYQCVRRNKPFFFFIRQNLTEQVRHRNQGLKKWISVFIVAILESRFKALARQHLTFTVGQEMYREYKMDSNPIFPVVVSLIREEDIEPDGVARTPTDKSRAQLLSGGRLEPEKGIIYLLGAVEQLVKRRGIKLTLTIVGTGREERSLQREVKRLGISQQVHFLGYVPYGLELLNLYRTADVFVLPSLTGEGLPQVLLEAMAKGAPVVATRVGGIPQLIRHGENGFLVNPASAEELAAAIERMLTDKQLASACAKGGLETVREYTLEKQRDKIMAIVSQLLYPHPRPVAQALI